jgi:osmotically inducible lipoprotein OsmB
MRTSTTKTIACGLAVVMSLTVVGCSGQPLSTREKGTGIGALAGAGTGAIIGAAVGAPGAGAAIGGALGAGGGFLIGKRTAKPAGQAAPDANGNQLTTTGNRAAAPPNRTVQTATGDGIGQRVQTLRHPRSPASG